MSVQITSHLSQKTNQELQDIIQFTQDDYRPDVIPRIRSILQERGISLAEIDVLDAKYHKSIKSIKPPNIAIKQRGIHKYALWAMYLIGLMIAMYLFGELRNGVLNSIIDYANKK